MSFNRWLFILFCQLAAALALGMYTKRSDQSHLTSFEWSSITPTSELIWHTCYDAHSRQSSPMQKMFSVTKTRKVYCARLSVPLDYHEPSNVKTVSLALLKLEASPGIGKSLMIAPGGAGNSRVQSVLSMAENGFLDMIDPDQEFDFITFDQRGFGYTSPSAKCFESELSMKTWEQRMKDLGGLLSTQGDDDNLRIQIAGAKAHGALCTNDDKKTQIRQYMTTAYAARDLLEILKSMDSAQAARSRGVTKLRYVGLSYGTVLGLTFASLYPEYAGRVLLDGTVNAYDWTGKWQMKHLQDADAIWASFFADCFHAKAHCSLWRETDTVVNDVKARTNDLLESLKTRPLYSFCHDKIRIISYRDIRVAIVQASLSPAFVFPTLANILNEMLLGNTNITIDFPFDSDVSEIRSPQEEDPDTQASSNDDAGAALNCGDAEKISNSSIGEFKKYLTALENQTSVAAFWQAERRLRCLGWPPSLSPKWRFTGPFTSNVTVDEEVVAPQIMFLGNSLDSMTNIANAYQMARGFQGSVVLEQKARGHCALANGIPSRCTIEHVRAFLREGTMPKNGTICGAECNVFDGSCFQDH